MNRKDVEVFVKLLAPLTPHLAEEVWQSLGKKLKVKSQEFNSVHTQPWPKYNPKLICEETVTIVIQINGKVRAQLKVKRQESRVKEEIEKLAKEDEKIIKWLDGKKIKKVIFVPGKIINFAI